MFKLKNEYTDKLVAIKDAHLKVAQLRVPGQTIPVSRHHIEVVEYIHPREEEFPSIPTVPEWVIGRS